MRRVPTSNRQTDPAYLARGVLERFWDRTLPVKPEKLALAMGVRLVPRGGPSEPDYGFSGYYRLAEDGPMIEFNTADAAVRQRFTIAHELGHHVLRHRDSPRDNPQSFTAGVGDPLEREANQFAAEVLMPAAAVKSLATGGQVGSIEELARRFAVSKVAMAFRLKNLGLVP